MICIRTRDLSVTCGLVLLAVASAAAADQENWLSRASEAVRTTDYRGTLVYLRNGKMDTLHIVHRYRDGDERARLVSLTGAPREIIRANGLVTCALPAKHLVLVAHHPMPEMFSRVSQLVNTSTGGNYEIRDLGVARLAGRKCRAIAIKAQDGFRYGYRILIDIDTNLPLKLDLLNDDEVLEQLMFTDISFPEHIPDSALAPTFDIKGFREVHRKAQDVAAVPHPRASWH
ncbi:MAG: hypothetical protein L0H19_07900, partial [Salinisphaera sp.]|nr:hypothetical protein [Salinisphaera sp.]